MGTDQIESFGSSTIQHGSVNDRVYLMKLNQRDFPQILSYINSLAISHNYSKVFAKVPEFGRNFFEQEGYRVEASIPNFYRGEEDVFFMARYFHPDRLIDHNADQVQQVLEAAHAKASNDHHVSLPDGCDCRIASSADCEQMALLYQQVFASYPFPIHDPDYLVKTMVENVIYAGIWKDNQLLALASAEIDFSGGNAELTDFATDPEWRGHGLAHTLLSHLENEMRNSGHCTCYTIARATSFGMNICFAQHDYQSTGTLVKNTQISGGLESMNVWYKHVC
ncbi:MAG: putative beta-lysine N-acetyltransferase [Thermodesulfobacteriota bacterium]|nr:putative beta-lysine N-acetyltransferase [Thermodesulfobacteriota bacterium]